MWKTVVTHGEEQRCRRHDHHNGGDVHCVQSEESDEDRNVLKVGRTGAGL